MATRFYLPNQARIAEDGMNFITPFALDPGWEDTDKGINQVATPFFNTVYLDVNRRGTPFPDNANIYLNTRQNNPGWPANSDIFLFRAIARYPLATQTISGTFKGQIRVRHSDGSGAVDARSQVVARVLTPTGTLRGTLYGMDVSALSNEWPTGATYVNRKFPLNWSGAGATLTNVNAVAGDYLVLEVGARMHSAGFLGSVQLILGDFDSSFLPEDEVSTADLNPWFEFSHDFTFIQEDTVVRRRAGRLEQAGGVAANHTTVPSNFVTNNKDLAVQVPDVNHPTDLAIHTIKGSTQLGPYQHQLFGKSHYSNRNMTTTFAPYETQRRPSFFTEDGTVPPDLGGGLTRYYYMAWRDVDAAPSPPTFRLWTVMEQPDPSGAQYTGTKSGGSPITNAFVLVEWME